MKGEASYIGRTFKGQFEQREERSKAISKKQDWEEADCGQIMQGLGNQIWGGLNPTQWEANEGFQELKKKSMHHFLFSQLGHILTYLNELRLHFP